ncbi:hemoglobin subunit theta-1 isoform X1 [Camelus dromedarius]|uniref:hemoglobin subunit theta-1 isoform X1 n=1 Tax=Camelus dromedarius TaxID=9838 RepID=UPI00311A72AE
MVLAAEDRAAVRALWRKLDSNVHVYTTEALERTFLAFPSTKTHFHHLDLRPRSAQVRAHGEKVAFALTVALDHLDDLPRALSALRVLHSHKLRVDPVNLKVRSQARGRGLPSEKGVGDAPEWGRLPFSAAAGPLPAGDPCPALPRRLQLRPASLAGQVSEPRDFCVGSQLSLN